MLASHLIYSWGVQETELSVLQLAAVDLKKCRGSGFAQTASYPPQPGGPWGLLEGPPPSMNVNWTSPMRFLPRIKLECLSTHFWSYIRFAFSA